MRYLPIHIDLEGQTVLIIGGGPAAEAKLRTLIKTPARLVLIAPAISDEITRWSEAGQIEWIKSDWTPERCLHGEFDPAYIHNARLIYAATEDDQVNGQIADLGRKVGVLVNAADSKEACDFITPALVDRAPVAISIGTEGTSPGLARAIKADLETRLPSTLGRYALTVNALRAKVKGVMPDLAARQRFWADIFGGKALEQQLRLTDQALTEAVEAKLQSGDDASAGMVSLVGAGPGNPDLLTHQARQKLHSADVIIYDRLVSQGVLDFGRREAEYIYVGKIPGGEATPQGEINALIVAKARQGHSVVRLKSGDPLIFGRADEEIDALEAAGIAYDICPGITAAAAAGAAIGASLTSRGHNKSVSFMTGHDAKGFAEQDWASLAAPGSRAVVYMGIGASRFIQGRLMLHGADKNLPITIVENASRPEQIIAPATLGTLPEDLIEAGIKGPAVLMIGYALRDVSAAGELKQGGAS